MIRAGAVEIVILKRGEMRALNKKYRGQDYIPSVLTFPVKVKGWPEVCEDKNRLGQVLLCPTQIKKEARQAKISFEQRLAFCLAHSLNNLIKW